MDSSVILIYFVDFQPFSSETNNRTRIMYMLTISNGTAAFLNYTSIVLYDIFSQFYRCNTA